MWVQQGLQVSLLFLPEVSTSDLPSVFAVAVTCFILSNVSLVSTVWAFMYGKWWSGVLSAVLGACWMHGVQDKLKAVQAWRLHLQQPCSARYTAGRCALSLRAALSLASQGPVRPCQSTCEDEAVWCNGDDGRNDGPMVVQGRAFCCF